MVRRVQDAQLHARSNTRIAIRVLGCVDISTVNTLFIGALLRRVDVNTRVSQTARPAVVSYETGTSVSRVCQFAD